MKNKGLIFTSVALLLSALLLLVEAISFSRFGFGETDWGELGLIESANLIVVLFIAIVVAQSISSSGDKSRKLATLSLQAEGLAKKIVERKLILLKEYSDQEKTFLVMEHKQLSMLIPDLEKFNPEAFQALKDSMTELLAVTDPFEMEKPDAGIEECQNIVFLTFQKFYSALRDIV